MISPLWAFSDWALLFARIILGAIFFVHGLPKIKKFSSTSQWLESTGLKPGRLWGFLLVLAEVGASIFLIFGFLTQLAALAIAINMVVATLLVSRKKGFVGGWEFDLALFTLAILLFFLGGGAWSLDRFLNISIY